MERDILHLHVPAFPIAVARVLNHGLRERPVAVAPSGSERGVVLSVSSEARREGVWKGMPVGRALKRCPALKVIAPDPLLVERASQRLFNMAANYSPVFEPSRPGHIYLDMTGTHRLWGRARDAAMRLSREVAGLCLRAFVGVSGNKMVSSIASRLECPDGVRDVDHGREASFLAPLRTDVLPGIGDVRRRTLLEELNIRLVGELSALDMGSLRMIFGPQASVIRQRALGIDPAPVYPACKKPVVSEEIVFEKDENDDQVLLGALAGLVEICGRRFRDAKSRPAKAALLIRYSDLAEARCRISLGGGSDLYTPLKGLFLKLCIRRVSVRLMRVWFWDLSSGMIQLSLFKDGSPCEVKRAAAVTDAMDRIRKRHGEGLIHYGHQRLYTSERTFPLLQGLGDCRH
ncbi:MAG: DNA polymerase IV [Desulfobacteraceae bacterium]|nr:MAG: DNA polymerase IV [Desulfobacteraceae bacterium]